MVKYYAILKSIPAWVPLLNAPDLEHAEFFARGAFGDDLIRVTEVLPSPAVEVTE